MPLVDISFGDAIDRLSVLKVKLNNIKDSSKHAIVSVESNQLENSLVEWACANNIDASTFQSLLNDLIEINQLGWDQIEIVRNSMNLENCDPTQLHVEHIKMIQINDRRIKAKNDADKIARYHYHEIKSFL